MDVGRADSITNGTSSQNKCTCVRHYVEVVEQQENAEGGEEATTDAATRQRCRCDCSADNDNCDWLKKGKEGFPIEDRR